MSEATGEAESAAAARAIVADLFQRKPWIYWTDLVLTIAVGYTAAGIYLRSAPFSLLQWSALVVCGFALFRAGSFVHEIAHLRRGEMTSFRVGWNLVCGIPMIMPSHFYENHIDHHNSHHYGTLQDGEYLPLGAGPWRDILWFFAQVPLLPAYIALRLLFAPLSFVHPRVRNFVLERMSSYVINFRHRLRVPAGAPRRAWAVLETLCSLRVAGMFAVVLIGVFPASRIVQLYVLAVFTMLLNYIRNLVAHRYQNTGERMTHAEQLADSINITGHPLLTELFFPLGLRYHALHHWFPGIPYHNLGRAHRRLMEQLPADSPYRETVFPSYWAALRNLSQNVRNAAPQESSISVSERPMVGA